MKLEDKFAISELLARAAYGLDTKDLQLLKACFTAEAGLVFEIGGTSQASSFSGWGGNLGSFRGHV